MHTPTNGEIVQAELSTDCWQTVAEVQRRTRIAGWLLTSRKTRGVLHHLVVKGVAVMEIRKGPVSSGIPGCPNYRKIQMFRLKSGEGE